MDSVEAISGSAPVVPQPLDHGEVASRADKPESNLYAANVSRVLPKRDPSQPVLRQRPPPLKDSEEKEERPVRRSLVSPSSPLAPFFHASKMTTSPPGTPVASHQAPSTLTRIRVKAQFLLIVGSILVGLVLLPHARDPTDPGGATCTDETGCGGGGSCRGKICVCDGQHGGLDCSYSRTSKIITAALELLPYLVFGVGGVGDLWSGHWSIAALLLALSVAKPFGKFVSRLLGAILGKFLQAILGYFIVFLMEFSLPVIVLVRSVYILAGRVADGRGYRMSWW
eukprot:c17293_g1_i1.p1 GENE.c17293_g1_i1~~c17293_g1_i1.p1  ORF type:complete len:283 (+),score=33.74 c17293_g1_i1:276-1124(+)